MKDPHKYEDLELPCTDPENMGDWFAETNEPGGGKRRRKAIRACHLDCPMKARLLCLDDGLQPENTKHGIWGGYTDTERRAIVNALKERGKTNPNRAKLAKHIISLEHTQALEE